MKYRAKITTIAGTLVTDEEDAFYYQFAREYGNTVSDKTDVYLECDTEEAAELFEELNKEYGILLNSERRIKEIVKLIKFETWTKSK